MHNTMHVDGNEYGNECRQVRKRPHSQQGAKANVTAIYETQEKLVPYWLLHDFPNVATSKTNEPGVDKSLLLLLFFQYNET